MSPIINPKTVKNKSGYTAHVSIGSIQYHKTKKTEYEYIVFISNGEKEIILSFKSKPKTLNFIKLFEESE